MQHCQLCIMKTNYYITDEKNIRLKKICSAHYGQMCHAHYKEQDTKRYFFMVEAFR